MIKLILLISFVFDSVLSNVFTTSSIFLPLCTITSFVIIYPLLKNDVKYYIYIIVIGILFDISYGDIYLLNVVIFSVVGLLIHFIHHYFDHNYFTFILELIITISFYRLVSYIISIILGVNGFHIYLLFESIYKSLLINIIYGLILYLIIKLINKKKVSRLF